MSLIDKFNVNGSRHNLNTETDKTLTRENVPADAKAVNARLTALKKDLQELIDSGVGGGGQPVVADLSSKITDTNKLYVYLGSEPGYDYGYIYAYVNGEWKSTGIYGKGAKGEDGKDGENGTATDEQVNAWLDAHPEATISLRDGSVSMAKLAVDVIAELDDLSQEEIAEVIGGGAYSPTPDINAQIIAISNRLDAVEANLDGLEALIGNGV